MAVFGLLGLLGLGACTASEEAIAAPRDEIFFPAGMVIDPAGQFLYVTNANADLAYGDGTITVIDTAKADELIASHAAGALPPAYCRTSVLTPGTLLCDEEGGDSPLLVRESTVRVGNFAGELRLQELPSGQRRLFTTVRGDPSVTWVDVTVPAGGKPQLDCSKDVETTSGLSTSCDKPHRISTVFRTTFPPPAVPEEAVDLPAEPFGLALDPVLELGYVTHLSTGHVSLLDLRATNPEPRAIDFRSGFFTANTAGDLTAFAVEPRTPGDANGFVYLTSRTSARVAMFRVSGATPPAPADLRGGARLVPGPTFDLPSQFVPSGGTADIRGIGFSNGGDRAYLLSRSPAAVYVLDTTIDPLTRAPKNRVLDEIEVCAQPSLLRVRQTGDGVRLFVVCFAAGQVWVVDPASTRVVSVIETGRGPNAIEIRETAPRRAYVANFVENTIAIIELEPGPREHDVLFKLGGEVDRP